MVSEPDDVALNRFNSRLVVAGAALVAWFTVREEVLGSPSGSTVLVEWLGLLALTSAAAWTRWPTPKTRWGAVTFAAAAAAYLTASFQHQPDLGEWSMYWRGFGPRIAFGSLMTSVVIALIWPMARVRFWQCSKRSWFQVATAATRLLSVGALLWMLPSLLQPTDAWLNIGDSTEKVLDEIAGPVVGNVPGYNQSSGYSSLLGIPFLPLSIIDGYRQEKFTLLIVWVNLLILLVPLLIAATLRQTLKGMSWLAALVLAFATVTVSGRAFGNEPKLFHSNTSLFRELSFLARGVFPLLVGLLLAVMCTRREITNRQIAVVAFVASLSILNNPEFGIGSAIAAGAVVMFQGWPSARQWSMMRWYCAAVLVSLGALVVPGVLIGGDWFSRRLGMFVAVLSGEGATLSASSSRDIPALGVVVVVCSVAIATVAVVLAMKSSDREDDASSASVAGLYFASWILVSSPYILNAGGGGGFGSQFHLIPLVIMTTALVQMLVIPRMREATTAGVRGASLVPVLLLFSVCALAILHSPNATVEWQRVKQPIDDQKWTDEWSEHKLDYIRPEEVVQLADTVGGVSQVGWWYSHGNAIELLTGLENLLGTSVFEGAVKGEAIRRQACEPLNRSTLLYAVTDGRYASLAESCTGVSSVEIVRQTETGVVLLRIDR